jgi:hypothetical protein
MPSGSAMKCRSLPNFIAVRLLAASASSVETTTWPQRHFGKLRSNANGCRSRYNRPSVAASAGRTMAAINTLLLCQPSIRRNKLWLHPVLQPLPARPNARPGQSARGERLKDAWRRRKRFQVPQVAANRRYPSPACEAPPRDVRRQTNNIGRVNPGSLFAAPRLAWPAHDAVRLARPKRQRVLRWVSPQLLLALFRAVSLFAS